MLCSEGLWRCEGVRRGGVRIGLWRWGGVRHGGVRRYEMGKRMQAKRDKEMRGKRSHRWT